MLPHARIPKVIFERVPELGASGFLVYSVLALHAGAAGNCWPSIARICALSHLSRATVFRALEKLQHAGLVEASARPGSTTLYLLKEGVSPVRHPSQTGVSPVRRGGLTGETGGVSPMRPRTVSQNMSTKIGNRRAAEDGSAAAWQDDPLLVELQRTRGSWAVVEELERRRREAAG